MELARKSVRKRILAPFGNHWVAVGALAGICIVSVLLVVLLQEQAGILNLPQSLHDADAPLTGSEMQKLELKSAADETAGGIEESADVRPEPARERFDFYSTLPEARHEMPTEERGVTAAAPPPMQAGRASSYVLQIEGFHSLVEARAMQDKLKYMRLDSRIERGDGMQAGYLVRVGPYTDLNELGRVEALLGKRGIKTTREPLP
jgi:cell division protein FtsN